MLGLDTSSLAAEGEEDDGKKKKKKELKEDDKKGGRRLQSNSINWVTAGKVSPVKNQGSCGSCWSFSATLALESAQAIATDSAPVRLSEQEGVDCTTNTQANFDKFGKVYGTYGCQGGWMAYYYQFAQDNGAMTNEDYPYVQFNYRWGDSAKACQHDDSRIAARAGEFGQITGTLQDAVNKLA